MTLCIVTQPSAALELRWCIDSLRKFADCDFDILLITESRHVPSLCASASLREIKNCRIEAMQPEAEAITDSYLRQMAAKLLIARHTADPQIVITDDDTEAIAPWDASTFFVAVWARIFYQHDARHFWADGTREIFQTQSISHRFQILLPFAIHGHTLADLARSDIAARALSAWHRRRLVSEFEIMGEFARREPVSAGRNTFLDALKTRAHWTTGARPAFRDWQAFRQAFRKSIVRRLPKSSS